MNYEPVNTERTFNFNNEGNAQKKPNTMNLWQMIICAVLLVCITASMFLPVFRFNGDAVVGATKDIRGVLGEEISEQIGLDDIEDVDKYKKEFDEDMKEEHIRQYISAFDIMTKGIYKMLSSETISEDDIKDSINDMKENAESDDPYAKAVIGVISKYTFLRVCLWVMYMLALVLLIPLFLGYFMKWNKYIFSGIGAGYGAIGVIAFGYLRFGLMGSIFKKVAKVSLSAVTDESSPLADMGIDFVKKPIVKALSNFYSVGFLITFILFILVVAICAVTMFVGNKKADVVPVQDVPDDSGNMYDDEYNRRMVEIERQRQAEEEAKIREAERLRREQQRKPKMGKVKCIAGAAVGQGFLLPADKKVVVGKSKVNANLIIDNPNVSNIHCSIRYNPAHNSYIVKDHSLNGTFVNGVKIQKDVAMEYPSGTVLSLADGSNQIKLG